ncbi:DUF1080 domain-containing protein [Pedobacter heparinus]|uniref:3-keto-disaccharide hydrolase n=1 Tax=Pedobacter heparinus TaxID=984 RepID=UPI00292F3871|nr:DUF1080 domain-containing protein [Pedobacter heparinus]
MKRIVFFTVAINIIGSMAFGMPGYLAKVIPPARKAGWIVLFDGKSLTGWHLFNKTGEIENWKVEDGALVCHGFKGPSGAGDLVSDQQFENFELSWEWKVDKGSNSGVFYHILEGPKFKRASETAPEYQIIDDVGFPAKLEEWQKTGADYAMNVPNDKKRLKPTGEWNTGKIVFNKGHVEHWLNGKKILEFDAWTEDWNKQKKEGKWKDYPDYGSGKTGAVGFQDHGNKAYFKNIKIRQIK